MEKRKAPSQIHLLRAFGAHTFAIARYRLIGEQPLITISTLQRESKKNNCLFTHVHVRYNAVVRPSLCLSVV